MRIHLKPANATLLTLLTLWAVVVAGGCRHTETVAQIDIDAPRYSYTDPYGDPYDFDDSGGRSSGPHFAGAVQIPIRPKFRLDDIDDEWDDSTRVELQLALHSARDIQVETVTGGYLYYEEKRWRDGAARAHFESAGAGMEIGALLYPFTYADGSTVDFAFYPFLRYGLGTASGRFRNVPTTTDMGSGTGTGDLGDFRIDGGLGADLRLLLGNSLTLVAGVGVTWWDTLDTAIVSVRDGTGTIIIDDEDMRFDGRDTYFRLTVVLSF